MSVEYKDTGTLWTTSGGRETGQPSWGGIQYYLLKFCRCNSLPSIWPTDILYSFIRMLTVGLFVVFGSTDNLLSQGEQVSKIMVHTQHGVQCSVQKQRVRCTYRSVDGS